MRWGGMRRGRLRPPVRVSTPSPGANGGTHRWARRVGGAPTSAHLHPFTGRELPLKLIHMILEAHPGADVEPAPCGTRGHLNWSETTVAGLCTWSETTITKGLCGSTRSETSKGLCGKRIGGGVWRDGRSRATDGR